MTSEMFIPRALAAPVSAVAPAARAATVAEGAWLVEVRMGKGSAPLFVGAFATAAQATREALRLAQADAQDLPLGLPETSDLPFGRYQVRNVPLVASVATPWSESVPLAMLLAQEADAAAQELCWQAEDELDCCMSC